jgi:hypothetical protein
MPAAPPPGRFELFGQTLERLSSSLEYHLRDTIGEVASDLEQAGQDEPSQRDRQSMYAIAAMLRIETRARLAALADALHDRAHKCLEYAGSADSEQRALALMEEDELLVQILATEIAREARQLPGAAYESYAGRVRAMTPGLWEDDDLNPLGARTLASAVLSSFRNLGEGAAAEPVLRQALRTRLPPLIATTLSEVEPWLRAQGVEPARPPPTPSRPEVSAPPPVAQPDEPPAEKTAKPPAQALRAIDASAQAADSARVLGSSPLAAADDQPNLGAVATLQPVVELEADAVAFAHSIDVAPYSREARAGFFSNLRSRLREAGVSSAQLAAVDLVAAMFDYVVDDRRLPEAAKPLIWRLQQPSVALSLMDPAYLGDEPRSLRRLVENVGAIVNAFADDLTRGSELYRRLETVVRAVEIVAGALQTRSAVMARQVQHEYSRAARNVTQLIERVVHERSSLESAPGRRNRRDYRNRPDHGREQEVTERLSQMLGERLARHDVPESVREFVLNVWLRHLRTAVLRDGEESSEFKVALQTVDDLLWSLDRTKERQSRRELAQKIPPLIRLLTQGLRAIGAKDEEFKPFFDELFLIHLRKMQRRARSGDNGASGVAATTTIGEAATTGFGPTTRTRTSPGPPTGRVDGFFDAPEDGGEPAAPRAPDLAGRPPASERPAWQAERRVPASPGGPTPSAGPGGPPGGGEGGESPGDGTDRKLLEVLSSIDLNDLPASPEPLRWDPEQAFGTLHRGHWLRLVGRDGIPVYVKVAWINARRTVVLMVRHPDRRALSMRASELLERFAQGRAARIR